MPVVVDRPETSREAESPPRKEPASDGEGPSYVKADESDGKSDVTGSGESHTDDDGFVSRLDEYNELFKDRYTDKDPLYMSRVNNPIEPIIFPNWEPPRQFARGGWRGGNQNRYNNNWRGSNGQNRNGFGGGYYQQQQRSWNGGRDRSPRRDGQGASRGYSERH